MITPTRALGPVLLALALAACSAAVKQDPGVINVEPASVTVAPRQSVTFVARAGGAVQQGVIWSVREAGGGTITAEGIYTAPATPSVYHVVATRPDAAAPGGEAVVAVATVSVQVSPGTAVVPKGGSHVFTALVNATGIASSAIDTSITWSVQEAGGGTIDASGLYTAPMTAGTYHVIGRSNADPAKSDTATVTVPAVSVAIAPAGPITVYQGQTQALTATVTGAPAGTVTWSVSPGGGSVAANGTYTAPATPGTYTVTATSTFDATAKATLTVNVPAVTVAITPASPGPVLAGSSALKLTATVAGAPVNTVTWTVSAGGGSVAADGTFSASGTPGTYTITAASTFSPAATAGVSVIVYTVSVTLSPKTVTIPVGAQQQFNATVATTP